MTKQTTRKIAYAVIAGLILGGFGITDAAFAESPVRTDLTAEQQAEIQAELDRLYEEYEKAIQEIQKQEQEIYEKHNVAATEFEFELDAYFLEDEMSAEDEKMLAEIDAKYAAAYREFGFVEPELSEERQAQAEKAFAEIDAEYDRIFEQLNDPKISEAQRAGLERQLDALDAEYDRIHADFGFTFPELTEEEQMRLDEKLSPLWQQEQEIYEKYGYIEDYADFGAEYDDYLSPEELREMDEIDAKYAAAYGEFGFVEPELSESQWAELDEKLSALDSKYEEVLAKMDDPKTPDAELAGLERQLDALDAEYDRIHADFGFTFPELTEEQERSLDEKLASIDEQYGLIYDEHELDPEHEYDYHDYGQELGCEIEVDEEGLEYEVCH